MADAKPSIGVVTTLQNKVGTSLTGITSLLSLERTNFSDGAGRGVCYVHICIVRYQK